MGGVGAAIGTLLAEIFILFAWLVVTNHLTDVLKINILYILLSISICFGLIFYQVKWGLNLYIRIIISFLTIVYILLLPETKRLASSLKNLRIKKEINLNE